MPTITHRRAIDAAPYAPPARDELLAEGLRCIVEGRPLPDALRPPRAAFPAVASVADGIARILAGPGGAPAA